MKKVINRLKQRMQLRWRTARMNIFIERTQLQAGHRILDLGGTPSLWEMIDFPLEVTLLNLPRDGKSGEGFGWIPTQSKHSYHPVYADACQPLPFVSGYFDLVFSNSLIEHVPDVPALAENIQTAAPAWWVQTPSRYFPVEAHCNLPFWWHYPDGLKAIWLRHWKRVFPFGYHQMMTTIAFNAAELRHYFPTSDLYVERVGGFVKSYAAFRPIK